MRVGVCLYARDEEKHIAEWLAYQDAVGFDTCFLYDNGSVDQTSKIARAMGKFQDIRVQDWGVSGPRVQMDAYDHCVRTFGKEFDWIAFLDADEFIVPHTSESIGGFMQAFSNAAAVGINWMFFGSNGQLTTPALQLKAFTRRALVSFTPNLHFKTIARPSEYLRMINPHYVETLGAYVSSDGSMMEIGEVRGVATSAKLEHCQINHYFVRSKEQWAAKVTRGYQDAAKRTMEQFAFYDRNEIIDTSALRYLERVRERLMQLHDTRTGHPSA